MAFLKGFLKSESCFFITFRELMQLEILLI